MRRKKTKSSKATTKQAYARHARRTLKRWLSSFCKLFTPSTLPADLAEEFPTAMSKIIP